MVFWADGSGCQVWEFLVVSQSLPDQDKQQISFFIIRSPVDYSDRLCQSTVEIVELKVLDLQFLKVLVSVWLSLWLCTILMQFVTFMPFLDTLNPFSIKVAKYETRKPSTQRNIVSLQVFVNVSRFSPCVINLLRNKTICCELRKVVPISRAWVYFELQILAL